MKVKIGDKIYDSSVEPVMLILTDSDKKNISKMPEDNYKYASFPYGTPESYMYKFMEIDVKEPDLILTEIE